MTKYKDYWFSAEIGTLTGNSYKFDIQQNIVTDKYRIVFTGLKTWNQHIKYVRYYATKPTDKNIRLTVTSL